MIFLKMDNHAVKLLIHHAISYYLMGMRYLSIINSLLLASTFITVNFPELSTIDKILAIGILGIGIYVVVTAIGYYNYYKGSYGIEIQKNEAKSQNWKYQKEINKKLLTGLKEQEEFNKKLAEKLGMDYEGNHEDINPYE